MGRTLLFFILKLKIKKKKKITKMGKGFENYMSKKWFHPTNMENQKRKFLAEKKETEHTKRQDDLREQYAREQEEFCNKQLIGDEKARLGLSFMYNAPALLKDQ